MGDEGGRSWLIGLRHWRMGLSGGEGPSKGALEKRGAWGGEGGHAFFLSRCCVCSAFNPTLFTFRIKYDTLNNKSQ